MIRTNWRAAWCRPVRSSVADGETRPHRPFCTFTVEYYAGIDGAAVCAQILAQTFRRDRQRPCAAGYETPHRNAITSYKDAAGGYCAGIVLRCVHVAVEFSHTDVSPRLNQPTAGAHTPTAHDKS